ncbi:hypothetical protein M409DRAFT_36848 [Zasmidium cellare ATCC 36951]|uniref:Major facilitator superfamily (MFS) profile domain-containing protein n=1 Tax=Zasmidium cellare ATCC 36951 TaxID=1080233 RepID=A0A6A6CG14_ZASCE|nr:uncharacterized protein M409DRAFT_36848 [Zasmidium cellare ATCC 36951]KAF2165583.1 hypothetical protein M409DRAFT_36848 [Zasmidium cellare ATCC 36951]
MAPAQQVRRPCLDSAPLNGGILTRALSPSVQILIISASLFFNPGLYLALLGAGGGRPSSTTMSNIANGVLYGVFSFSAIGAGSLLNTIGPRWTLLFGITGYPIYQGALWYFDVYGHLWFPVFAGAYLGLSAGCLWTTAMFAATAYPEERDKGSWRSIQWTLNISGSAIGAAVALGISWNSTREGVPHSVYIIFIVLQCCSMALTLFVKSPDKLRRSDGTALARFDRMSLLETLRVTGQLLKDWRILIMLPAFFTPEMFFPFQSSMNAYIFNLRTRTLNTLLNNLIQIPTALGLGFLLDNEKLGSRRRRAFIGITIDMIWITGTYIAQTVWLSSWNFDRSVPGPSIDCTDPVYAGAVVIYMLYAAQYGIFQNMVIYVIGTLTNEPRKTAAVGGLFVGVLSAGTTVSFGVDATSQPYENENAAYFALSLITWPILYFVAWKYTTPTNYLLEDDVIAPVHVREELGVEGSPSTEMAEKTEYIKKEKENHVSKGP